MAERGGLRSHFVRFRFSGCNSAVIPLEDCSPPDGGSRSLEGEPCKGITASLRSAVIPFGGTLQRQITPGSLRSPGFLFSSGLAQASLARPAENKNPAAGCGSNLALRREGEMNHLYEYLTIQLFRIYNSRCRLRISGNFRMSLVCYQPPLVCMYHGFKDTQIFNTNKHSDY